MPSPPERPLRVTLCPVNTAGVPWTTAEALRRRGVDARLVVFGRYRLHPEADESLERSGGPLRRQATQWRALARLLPRTDVFHFVFGLTLVPQTLQFPILRAARKKSVMHYLGSDIRGKTPGQLAYGKKADAELIGWYGIFAIEAMALGKPVVTFLHDEAVRRTEEAFGVEVPIVSATKETLRDQLEPLVADAEVRRRLGAASRTYVER